MKGERERKSHSVSQLVLCEGNKIREREVNENRTDIYYEEERERERQEDVGCVIG